MCLYCFINLKEEFMRKIKPIEIEIREDTHKCLSCNRTFYKIEDACPYCGEIEGLVPLGLPVYSAEDIDRITELNRRLFANKDSIKREFMSKPSAPSEDEMIAYVENLNQRFRL
jgi:hypothetical protein